jgi:Serine/threonine protein phosphatase
MNISVAKYSVRGGRPQNEDAVYTYQADGIFIAIAADGLGMHGGGDIASATAAEVLSGRFISNAALEKDLILENFMEANNAILSKQTASCQMKSTAAVLYIIRGRYALAHIGDTRIYHFRNQHLLFQTIDHSVSQAAVFSGEIDASQIRYHEDRNRLLRALGIEGKTQADIFIPQDRVRRGDAFLLCTDGFWEYIWEQEMALDLTKSADAEQWISNMFARIGKRIDGGNDNLSAIAIMIMSNQEE